MRWNLTNLLPKPPVTWDWPKRPLSLFLLWVTGAWRRDLKACLQIGIHHVDFSARVWLVLQHLNNFLVFHQNKRKEEHACACLSVSHKALGIKGFLVLKLPKQQGVLSEYPRKPLSDVFLVSLHKILMNSEKLRDCCLLMKSPTSQWYILSLDMENPFLKWSYIWSSEIHICAALLNAL